MKITVNKKKFKIPIINNVGIANLSVKEDWISRLFKMLDLPAGSSFIDIGVNVGQTLIAFKSCYDNPYWGFEPNPNCVSYLQALIKSNNLEKTFIVPVGLSSNNNVAKFYLKNDTDTGATAVQDLRPDFYEQQNVNYVPLFAFDTLGMPEIGTISLIKIDVEGGELEVISGLLQTLKKSRPVIICEILDYHSEKSKGTMQARANQLVEHLQQIDYLIFRAVHEKDTIKFELVNVVTLNLWKPESWNMNDYLFVAKENQSVINKLK